MLSYHIHHSGLDIVLPQYSFLLGIKKKNHFFSMIYR